MVTIQAIFYLCITFQNFSLAPNKFAVYFLRILISEVCCDKTYAADPTDDKIKVFIHCCRWIKSSSPWNPVFRSYFEFSFSSIDRVITETWVFSCCREACVISSSPSLPKIVQAEKCDYSFWLGARGENRQHDKMCVCVWIPTVLSHFPSAGDDVSVGSACSSDPPALPTYPWPLPPQPNGTCIYREWAGKCSISLEMQTQTYLVQTVDSGWVQIRPVLLPKRERDHFHKSGCSCVFDWRWEDTRLKRAFFSFGWFVML